MVGDLQVQSAVEEGEILGTNDVRRRAQLSMEEGLGWSEVASGTREVGQHDLWGGESMTCTELARRRQTWTCNGLGTTLLTTMNVSAFCQLPQPRSTALYQHQKKTTPAHSNIQLHSAPLARFSRNASLARWAYDRR